MAHQSPSGGMPLDQPKEIAPGITHREADFQGSDKFGFGVGSTPGTTLEGAVKGNLPFEWGDAPKPLTGPGPFENLKGGK